MSQAIVLKIGGSLRGQHLNTVAAALSTAAQNGLASVVVHGGGPQITEELRRRNIELPFVDGLRQTTDEAMEVVERVLADDINPALTAALTAFGLDAVATGRQPLLSGQSVGAAGRTGEVSAVDSAAVARLLDRGQVPVLAPVAYDATGRSYNVNADLAAAAVARALRADRILFFTDVAGIYADFAAGVRLVDTTVIELKQLLAAGSFSRGMIPKVDAVCASLENGVEQAFVLRGDGAEGAVLAVTVRPDSPWDSADGTRIACGVVEP